MFRRILIEDWTVIFTLIAFATAGSVYLAFFIKALRMQAPLQERLSRLPLGEDREEARHE